MSDRIVVTDNGAEKGNVKVTNLDTGETIEVPAVREDVRAGFDQLRGGNK